MSAWRVRGVCGRHAARLRQLYLAHSQDQACRAARAGRHPLRRGLRRRHAADRRPLHERDRGLRERPRDSPRLSRRDPRACGVAAGRLGVPGALRGPRHPHARRPAERARRHESGGAQGQHRRPREGRDGHRQHRRFQRPQPPEGRLCGEPARGRVARRLPRPRGCALVDDGRSPQGRGRHHVARGRALEELLRSRAHVLALPPARRRDAGVHRVEVREAARDRGGEYARVQGGVELRRDLRGLRGLVRGRPGAARTRDVPADLREYRALVRARRREQAVRAPTLPRGLPDHAGLGRARGARAAQALRRADVPGRGRDRCRPARRSAPPSAGRSR